MGRISSQIRLAVHVVLACLRRCSADLEKTSASITVAGLFQVRQQESKGLEQDTYRKSGGGAELRKAAGQHQAAVSFFGQSGCNMPGDAGGAEGELARPRPPPLCTLDHHSHPTLAVCLRSSGGKARRCHRYSYYSWKLHVCTGSLRRPRFGRARAAAQLGKPSRVAARGALAGAVVHGAALGRAGARPARPSRSPRAHPLRSRCWGEPGAAGGRLWDACATVIMRNVKSRHPPPRRRGPSQEARGR